MKGPTLKTNICLVFLLVIASVIPVCGGQMVWPMPEWPRATPADMGMNGAKLREARDYALAGGGSGYITRSGKLVLTWGDPKRRYDLKSTTKSFGSTALGLAIKDGKMKLNDKARKYHPTFGTPPAGNTGTGWLDDITLWHLATHTSGFAKSGGYTALEFAPGTQWNYSDGGPNWLAECLTLLYKQDLRTLMFERVFTPIGIKDADLTWRDNVYRPHEINGIKRREFGSGISANVDTMARIGYLYLCNGRWQDKQILPGSFVDVARKPISSVVGLPVRNPDVNYNASDHYGLLWWNNADGTLENVPKDAYWSWGLYESMIVVIPSLDIVVARAGKSWQKKPSSNYKILKPFLEPIVASVRQSSSKDKPPYPPSPVIAKLTWADPSTIVRRAKGSDNWPLTWADDDHLYTAYGDGWGFEKAKVTAKLSLGVARIIGAADDFVGINIRSPSAEQTGDGPTGKKASGMLMVDGVLYMVVRNAGNSQLAWSNDHGKSWKWSEWKFTQSFGCPTFLNFAANYASARDEYVYVYSHDKDTAYIPSNRMILARVPKNKITARNYYRFFKSLDSKGKPFWTEEINKRGAVFVNPGQCYRSSVSYNSVLKRYLWCQIIPARNKNSRSGIGLYDAPEPWGPWTTIYYNNKWDVDPGESASIPTKWISQDGTAFHLVFSGDDTFSVRKATLTLSEPRKSPDKVKS
ncbi:MAG: serine hydrolase [Planctomycetota bacterium]|nr:MAG: serine hydrolase [Planctomycetota bacterium]